jgi:mRNA-degrading endonuclease HigB of HigAB toxin-antitoxin module
VTVLSRRRIRDFAKKHADAANELNVWFTIANRAEWKDLAEVRVNFADADQGPDLQHSPKRLSVDCESGLPVEADYG